MTLPRPYIPLKVRLTAALLQLGLDPARAQLDHDPALELRKRTDDGGYIPPANDPRYLVYRSSEAHERKTNGPGGEKRITTRGSDTGEAKKLRHLTAQQEESRRRMLAKECGNPPPRTGKIQSRGFDRRSRRMRKGKT